MWVFAVGTCVAILAVCHLGFRAVLDSQYFALREVRIVGVSREVGADLDQLVKQSLGSHASTLGLDLKSLRASLSAHPRLRQVSVEIAYPHALIVRGIERTPVAIVNADGFYLVARDGVVIEQVRPADLRHYNLPYITGIASGDVEVGKKIASAGLARALDMMELLRERNAELYSRFSEVNVSQDPVSQLDNVTARLRGGMEVRFGDANPVEKLPVLDYFIQQQQRAGNDPFGMAYVDLRVPNQIVYLDKLTAAALRSGALDPALGSLGPQPAQSTSSDKSGASSKNADNARVDDTASETPKKNQAARRPTPASVRTEAPAENAPADSAGGAEEADQSQVDSATAKGWRGRLSLPFFSRRHRQAPQPPVLLAPVDSTEHAE